MNPSPAEPTISERVAAMHLANRQQLAWYVLGLLGVRTVKSYEKFALARALEDCDRSTLKVADMLGMSQRRVIDLCRRWDMRTKRQLALDGVDDEYAWINAGCPADWKRDE